MKRHLLASMHKQKHQYQFDPLPFQRLRWRRAESTMGQAIDKATIRDQALRRWNRL